MASPNKQLWDYRSALSAFRAAIKDIDDVFEKLHQSKVNNQDALVDFRSYLHSGSATIIANGNRISAVCANNSDSTYLTGEELLIRLMNAATEYLRRKPLDANDESKFRTMDLSFSLSISLVEGDVDTSRKEVEKHFSSIGKAHDVIFEIINNTPPIVLHGASSVALNNLESAFAKNMEDPFWLVKSAGEPFPDLITLSWPSPHRAQDPVAGIMKRCSKKWVEKEKDLDVLTEKTLGVVANSFCQAEAAMAEVQIEGDDAQGPFNEAKQRVAATNIFLKTLTKSTKKPLRVALTGCMSHGKSSFINSLIGQELLISEDVGSTSIPMLVQHNENSNDLPTLYITPDLFSEYIQTLKDLQNDPTYGLRIASNSRMELLNKRQRENLADFKKGWAFETSYVGAKAIIETQHKIIDLIRLCALLAPDSTPKPKGSKWPKMSVYMHEMAQLRRPYFEIIDLPGYGDLSMGKDSALLETLYHDVFLNVDGVILVAALLDEPQSHANSVNVLQCGRDGLLPGLAPILLSVGTKKDLQRKTNWTMKNAACSRIFQQVDSLRFLQTSPVIYLEGTSAKKYLDSAQDDFMKQITLEELKEKERHLYAILERIYTFDGPSSTPQEDQTKFEDLKIQEIRIRVQRLIESAGYGTVRDGLDKYIIDTAMKRRYLSFVADLRIYIEQVEEAEASALRTSHGRDTVRKAIEEERKRFSEITKPICDKWKQARKESMDEEANDIMGHAVSVAYTQAFSTLKAIVERLFSQYSQNSDSKFESSDKAVDFLFNVERELRQSLDIIQRNAVKLMRTHGQEVWIKSVDNLRDRLRSALLDNDATILRQFKLDLDHDLKELSGDSIATQVQQKIEDYLRSSASSAADVKGKARKLMHTMGALRKMEFFYSKKPAKSKLPKTERSSPDPMTPGYTNSTHAGGSISPGVGPAGPVLSPTNMDEQEFGDRSINDVGFLVRASPSGATVKTSVSREIWPWIDNEPGAKVVLHSTEVVDQYRDWVLRHWKGVLEQECKISIQGAIKLSIERGEKCVERFMMKKEKDLSETQESSKRPFPEDILEQLVLFRANAISTGEITHTLGEKLYEHVACVDNASRTSLPPNVTSMFRDASED